MPYAAAGTVNTSDVPLWSGQGLQDEFWKVFQAWWWVLVILFAVLVVVFFWRHK